MLPETSEGRRHLNAPSAAPGAALRGPTGLTIRELVLGRRPPPGQCTDSRRNHTLVFFVKEAHLLVLELQPERQALGLGHI